MKDLRPGDAFGNWCCRLSKLIIFGLELRNGRKRCCQAESAVQSSVAADAWQAGVCGHASRNMDSRRRSHGRDISVNFEGCGFG